MNTPIQEYIVFRLNHEYFCVKLQSLDRVMNQMTIRKVPNLPPYMLGVIELDEQIVPIIDLKQRMNLASESETIQSSLVLFFVYDNNLLGFLADDIFEIKETNVEPKNEFSYIPNNVRIFSSGTLRMKDDLFISEDNSDGEELVILLSTTKIYEVIEKELNSFKEVRFNGNA